MIGPDDQGILLEHRESEFGDHADHATIMEAVGRMRPASEDHADEDLSADKSNL